MTSDSLLDQSDLGFEEWAVTPDPDTLTPQSVKREQQSESFRQSVREGGAIVLTHGDADGLTSGALVRLKEGPETTVQTISYYGAYGFEDALEDLVDLDVSGRSLYILDFNPDGEEAAGPLHELRARGNEIRWFDHHQWDDDVLHTYRTFGGARIFIDEDECTASLLWRDYIPHSTEKYADLVEVTKDRDLWIRDDPRSEDLATFAKIAETDEYIETVIARGPDLPTDVIDMVREEQEQNGRLEEYAVEQATFHEVEGYDVAFAYISGGVSSNIGNELVEYTKADVAFVANPYGGVSVYSHSDRETFARCHEVASHFDGGGHPTAAGFSLDFDNFREMAQYWATEGGSERIEVLIGFDEVIADE